MIIVSLQDNNHLLSLSLESNHHLHHQDNNHQDDRHLLSLAHIILLKAIIFIIRIKIVKMISIFPLSHKLTLICSCKILRIRDEARERNSSGRWLNPRRIWWIPVNLKCRVNSTHTTLLESISTPSSLDFGC